MRLVLSVKRLGLGLGTLDFHEVGACCQATGTGTGTGTGTWTGTWDLGPGNRIEKKRVPPVLFYIK